MTDEDYKQEFADVVNCFIHWTIDREFSLSLQETAAPFERIKELQKQFLGVSFAARKVAMKELCGMMYDSRLMSLNQHVMEIRGKRDHLSRIGVCFPDNVFEILLSNSVLQSFPDIAETFRKCLLLYKGHIVSSSDVMKVLGAADDSHRHVSMRAELMRVWARPRGISPLTEGRTCFLCHIKGHTICDCRKKTEPDKSKSSGLGSKSDLKSVRSREVEADVASVGFAPGEDPKEVTVSPISLTIDSSVAVFETCSITSHISLLCVIHPRHR